MANGVTANAIIVQNSKESSAYMYVCKDSAAPAHAHTRAHRPAAPHQSSGVYVYINNAQSVRSAVRYKTSTGDDGQRRLRRLHDYERPIYLIKKKLLKEKNTSSPPPVYRRRPGFLPQCLVFSLLATVINCYSC